MNTIALIVLPWLCGLASVLLACFLTMLRSVIRSEAVPAHNASENPDKQRIELGGPGYHWPGYVAYLTLISPYTWPVVWVIGIPLYSTLRWWLNG